MNISTFLIIGIFIAINMSRGESFKSNLEIEFAFYCVPAILLWVAARIAKSKELRAWLSYVNILFIPLYACILFASSSYNPGLGIFIYVYWLWALGALSIVAIYKIYTLIRR